MQSSKQNLGIASQAAGAGSGSSAGVRGNPNNIRNPKPNSTSNGNGNGRAPISHHHHHQNIPTLQVTIPPPAHHDNNNHISGHPRSPYRQNHNLPHQQQQQQRSPPRAAFGSPASPTSSAETLVNSPGSLYQGHNKSSFDAPKMPFASNNSYAYPSSPSITSFKQAALDQTRVADPDNDRLMPATPGAGPNNFWKRFSTVVHENERKEAMAEKMGGRKGKSSTGSEWLSKETGGQKKYRYWVGAVAFLIIAAIVVALVFHFAINKKDDDSDSDGLTNPTTHDFGLGDGSDGSSAASSSTSSPHHRAKTSAVDVDGAATTTSTMPKPSAVAAGETLRVRSMHGHATGSNGSHGLERRRLEDLD